MSITIASNLAALRAGTQLARTTSQLDAVYARLASGKRITRASDDAAGLALAATLNSDMRIASVALRNANDGISALSITDGALNEIGNVLSRMAEIAEQSANGTYSATQRSAMQNEFAALASEIERIAFTTKFNSISLLSGSNSISLQVGFNSFSTSQIQLQAIEGTLQSIRLASTGSSALSYSVMGATVDDSQNAARTALEAVLTAISEISTKRGMVGATESRLSHAVNALQSTRENFAGALSRIEDIDVAEETANLVRLQIMQQATTAILAQANQQPQLVLRLLGG